MSEHDDRNPIGDDVPAADAVEQRQETAPEPAAPDPSQPPMEAAAADWQEQRQEAAEADDDREVYPQ